MGMVAYFSPRYMKYYITTTLQYYFSSCNSNMIFGFLYRVFFFQFLHKHIYNEGHLFKARFFRGHLKEVSVVQIKSGSYCKDCRQSSYIHMIGCVFFLLQSDILLWLLTQNEWWLFKWHRCIPLSFSLSPCVSLCVYACVCVCVVDVHALKSTLC